MCGACGVCVLCGPVVGNIFRCDSKYFNTGDAPRNAVVCVKRLLFFSDRSNTEWLDRLYLQFAMSNLMKSFQPFFTLFLAYRPTDRRTELF